MLKIIQRKNLLHQKYLEKICYYWLYLVYFEVDYVDNKIHIETTLEYYGI